MSANTNLTGLIIESGGTLKIGSTTISEAEIAAVDGITATSTELNKLAGVVAGTVTASKAVVVGADKNLDTLAIADGGLKLGSGAGTAVGATAAELNTAADLSANGGLVRVKKLALAAASAETDTAFDLPAKSIVLDVWVDVTTAEVTGSTKTIDVGLLSGESGGDADGFLVGIDVSATGLKKGVATLTVGGTETYFSSTTRGVLLQNFNAGSNTAEDVGHAYDSPHLSTAVTAKSVSWSPGSAQTEFAGNLYIMYMEIG